MPKTYTEADLLRLAGDAITLYVEYTDVHGYEPDDARRAAIEEVMQGAAVEDSDWLPSDWLPIE